MPFTLTRSTVIDGTGTEPLQAGIRISDNTIVDVGPVRAERDDAVLDVTGLTLLPGLLDLHSHLGVLFPTQPEAHSPAVIAAHLFRNAERCLMSGHTTARELAGADGGLRQAIDLGLIPGPRLLPSGPLLCQSGGHGDFTPPYYAHHHSHDPGVPGLAQTSVVCDGPDEVRIAARNAFRRGASQIKVCISGGVVSLTDSLEDSQFTVQELRAAVDEAHARGTYVTAHAHSARSINAGLEAGIECFEHGTYLDEPTALAMARAGASLVPTFAVLEFTAERWRELNLPEAVLPRLADAQQAMHTAVKLAMDAGVRIGSGTDLLGPNQDGRGRELALKSALMGPLAAIASATSVSADIIRRSDLGRIAVGAKADIIAIDFDPVTSPDHWGDPARVVLVIKDGQVVKDDRAP